jgi:myo-inositol-hexaphosphate 3-phosphohydrolase
MSPTHSPITAKSRRTLGAALGVVLLMGAVPFFRSASASQPTGDATAAAETAPVSTKNPPVKTVDPAIWVNPQDATKSLILGANSTDGLAVYDMTGTKQAQPDVTSAAVSGVDTRNGFMLGGSPVSLAMSVGEGGAHGLMHFYVIDPTGTLEDKTAPPAGLAPVWHQGDISSVCLYRSPVTQNTYAFVMSPNGQMAQLQLTEDAGAIKVQTVRGYQSTPGAPAWDVNADAATTLGGCVVDDELKTLYVTEKDKGIWKFGAEPTDPMTGSLIDTPTTGTPAGHLTDRTLGLALVKTGDGAGYLMASSPAKLGTDPMADSFMVYDRAAGNAFIRSFHVIAGALDNCDRTDGIDAAAGNFGGSFTSGLFVCQDQTNENSSAPNGAQNYKLVPMQQIVDMAPPAVTTTTIPQVTTTTVPGQVQVPNRSGYWMVGSDGRVFEFGDARHYGNIVLAAGAQAVDLEPTPSGNGYWIIDDFGHVFARGDAKGLGDVDKQLLTSVEVVTSLSSTKTGNGYWVFTSLGRVIPFGDAVSYGSMGGKPLNKPVQSLVPDADGIGYWLVASDGGIFAFDADFRGSLGSVKLNKPVTGMVRYGKGYLMVGEDGGIFSFSDKTFVGSLGGNPPARPITSVAVLDAPAAQ